jgi:hypothetical protein
MCVLGVIHVCVSMTLVQCILYVVCFDFYSIPN